MENVLLWLDIIIGVLSGLSVAIPLGVTLYKTVKNLIQEKKWNELVKLVLGFMQEAEQKYSKGEDKKVLVMALAKSGAEKIGYNWNAETETKISEFIDSTCEASKILNSKVKEETK